MSASFGLMSRYGRGRRRHGLPPTRPAWRRWPPGRGERGVGRVGPEASGGYERGVMDGLAGGGIEVCRCNALQVRRFAQAQGRHAKNDRADARVMARFTATMIDTVPALRRCELDPLVEHLALRRRLVGWIGDCANQLEPLRTPALRRQVLRTQAGFERQRKALDAKLAALIEASADWRERARAPGRACLTAIPWFDRSDHPFVPTRRQPGLGAQGHTRPGEREKGETKNTVALPFVGLGREADQGRRARHGG